MDLDIILKGVVCVFILFLLDIKFVVSDDVGVLYV